MTRLRALLSLDGQRGALFLWTPVCLGIGIGIYFALPVEPSREAWVALAGGLTMGAVTLAAGLWRWPLAVGVVLVALGLGIAGLRSALVAGPVLHWRYYGAVEGRIVMIDRSTSDKTRLTLDRVVLERTDPARVPRRVRVSLHDEREWSPLRPGQTVVLTAHLMPPQGPVEPGGFDFRRMAWFDSLGAVGYTHGPALLLAEAADGHWIGRMRAGIGASIRATLPGETGAVATALTTGDRSGISAETLEMLRASNLAHLLAISGLHVGLLTGVVFGAIRFALVVPGRIALHWPVKSLAASGALACAAFYLAISGGNVATQRAFIMAAVMLIAILLGRRAISLRTVAIAALIVLTLRPEALTEPGFQMSFAATTALVAIFRSLSHMPGLPRKGIGGWLFSLVASSAIAGVATAPYSAAHFNQISQYGLLANLLSVPAMGVLVMPAAVLAAALSPLNGDWIGLSLMALGIDWILMIAHWVGGMEGAVVAIPAPAPAALPMLTLGSLTLLAVKGRARWLGAAPALLAVVLWALADRPHILIEPAGGLVGIVGAEGRVLSKPSGAGFAAQAWLEDDGDPVDQPTAHGRPGWSEGTATLPGLLVHHIYGREAEARATGLCRPGALVVTTADLGGMGDCLLFDETVLSRTGAVSITLVEGRPQIATDAQTSGRRPWSRSGGKGAPKEAPKDHPPDLKDAQ